MKTSHSGKQQAGVWRESRGLTQVLHRAAAVLPPLSRVCSVDMHVLTQCCVSVAQNVPHVLLIHEFSVASAHACAQPETKRQPRCACDSALRCYSVTDATSPTRSTRCCRVTQTHVHEYYVPTRGSVTVTLSAFSLQHSISWCICEYECRGTQVSKAGTRGRQCVRMGKRQCVWEWETGQGPWRDSRAGARVGCFL